MRKNSPEQSGPSEAILEGLILMTRNVIKAAEVLRPLSLKHPAYERLFKLAVKHLIEIGAITEQQELKDAVRKAVNKKGY